MKRLVATTIFSLVFSSGIHSQDEFRRLEILIGPQKPPVEKLDPVCPKLEMVNRGLPTIDGQSAGFVARLKGGDQAVTPIFLWTISAGTFMSGQDTHNPVVDTTGAGEVGSITARLFVGGYANECTVEGTTTVRVVKLGKPKNVFIGGYILPVEKKKITGKFAHFLDLDNRYAAILNGHGVLYLMVRSPQMECFLAAHQDQELSFSYLIFENFANGTKETFNQVDAIISPTGPGSPASWAAQEISKTSTAEHEKHCEAIVTKRIANRP